MHWKLYPIFSFRRQNHSATLITLELWDTGHNKERTWWVSVLKCYFSDCLADKSSSSSFPYFQGGQSGCGGMHWEGPYCSACPLQGQDPALLERSSTHKRVQVPSNLDRAAQDLLLCPQSRREPTFCNRQNRKELRCPLQPKSQQATNYCSESKASKKIENKARRKA